MYVRLISDGSDRRVKNLFEKKIFFKFVHTCTEVGTVHVLRESFRTGMKCTGIIFHVK